jgi:glycosyltransferase involved in cell wall biosynthesis
MIKISVIIPVYNRADLLPVTLRSLLAQSLSADEIIVIDDGSTDGTAEVAESFGSAVRVIRQENAGPGAARNRGLREAIGEFIHFFDSDDVPVLNKQECQLKALQQTNADVAISPWVKGSFSCSGFKPENHVIQQKGLPAGDLIQRLLCDWSIVPQSCMFRRSALEKIAGFPSQLFVGEDQLFFLRLLLTGAKVTFSPDTLTLYRTDNVEDKLSGSSKGEARRRLHWAMFLIMARKECLENGIDPTNWSGYRQRVWSAARDLAAIANHEDVHVVRNELLEILGSRSTRSYPLFSWLRQKQGGLQQRIIGRRGSASLRMGPMTRTQWDLTKEVVSLVNPSHT